MSIRLLIAAALLAALSQGAWAQGDRTQTTRTSLWLPSRATSAGNRDIYASVVTAAPESTEYLLACISSFASPYPSSCGDFAGVTLTHADGTMRIRFRSDTFDCDRGELATCSITQNGESTASPTVFGGAESSAWFTAVTIVAGQEKLRGGGGGSRNPIGNIRNGGLVASALALGGLLAAVVVFL
ncbi:hypothetical protein SODALDRAFT_323486 [Sodiomyces alkalinus F11]|uniref:Uncharacterized protein n=1 Tax=Sodiomyces alkalinus (strain CBS 110278 / VKM F-3762 / F11) TaxID=1314773 RepID=A0A3N2PXC9_SODAK|nr:hypothetical protein SODALDRAFT_323486 [Sodiomyces alkalinus F11]ROT39005.1 hypothetical protein SODALDRAFT_323486 [Sodiomyces alkalinus F11]